MRAGPGGQDGFAGPWASETIYRYRQRVEVAEGLAERMARVADDLCNASDEASAAAKSLRRAS